MSRLIRADVMGMTPKELKQLEKQVSARLKIELDILKLSPLTKQEKKLNKEYELELENVIDNEENEPEECLKLLKKMTLNTTTKQKHYRIVELQALYSELTGFKNDYSNKEYIFTQRNMVILSHYPIWNTCECK